MKLLVGVGVTNRGYAEDMEVLDVTSEFGVDCQNLKIPMKMDNPVAGLLSEGKPIVCGKHLNYFLINFFIKCLLWFIILN